MDAVARAALGIAEQVQHHSVRALERDIFFLSSHKKVKKNKILFFL